MFGSYKKLDIPCIVFVEITSRGYAETVWSFGTSNIDNIPESYVNWMKNLDFYLEVDNYIYWLVKSLNIFYKFSVYKL